MILFAVLFVVFLLIGTACWFQGLWSCAINVINLLLAMLIATNFYEPLATLVEGYAAGASPYILDGIFLWVLFAISYIILRMITHGLSEHNVQFIKPVELVGRSLLAIWCGWLFVCFTAFSMMISPIGGDAWDSPEAKSFLFMAPEQQWLSFAQSRSRGALSRGKFEPLAKTHPDDAAMNVEAFDPMSEYTYKYQARRKLAEN